MIVVKHVTNLIFKKWPIRNLGRSKVRLINFAAITGRLLYGRQSKKSQVNFETGFTFHDVEPLAKEYSAISSLVRPSIRASMARIDTSRKSYGVRVFIFNLAPQRVGGSTNRSSCSRFADGKKTSRLAPKRLHEATQGKLR